MKSSSNNSTAEQIKQLEEDISQLKIHLQKYHFTETPEQDFDIKTQIIQKQTEIIDLLIKERDENNSK